MMILYIMVTYLIMLGMLIESFRKTEETPIEAWVIWALSPITFPVIIGMEIADRKK